MSESIVTSSLVIALLLWILKKLSKIEKELGKHEAWIKLILNHLGLLKRGEKNNDSANN